MKKMSLPATLPIPDPIREEVERKYGKDEGPSLFLLDAYCRRIECLERPDWNQYLTDDELKDKLTLLTRELDRDGYFATEKGRRDMKARFMNFRYDETAYLTYNVTFVLNSLIDLAETSFKLEGTTIGVDLESVGGFFVE